MFGTHVADTIAKDVVIQTVLSIGVIFAGLLGAIVWDLITFWFGLPTSSSHALVGGMAGAAVAKAGGHVLVTEGLRKIGVFIILSPLIGLALGLILTVVLAWTFHRVRNVERLNRGFRRGPARLRRGVQPRPRRQRRPEDDGHHPRPADRRRARVGRRPTSRSGWCWPPTPPSASARSPAAGAS